MRIVLPNRGEFGLRIWGHVPAVHGLDGGKVVLHEPGEECLYPAASCLIEVPAAEDATRRGYDIDEIPESVRVAVARMKAIFPGAEPYRTTPRPQGPRFVPLPLVGRGTRCDVVVCPRRREYGAAKNWPGWAELTALLQAQGLEVFAGGTRETSYLLDVPAAWDHPRELDGTVEAMHAARLVIATDAGLAHLAVLCGRPLLLITHDDGIVAPGPVTDAEGRVLEPRYWPVRIERYHEANHRRVPIRMVRHAWHDPEWVALAAREMLA